MTNIVHLQDCIQGMKQFPDNHFDLAVVDPEYGIGTGAMGYLKTKRPVKQRNGTKSLFTPKTIYDNYQWDNNTPQDEYFEQLFRVSKNQIIWGANYFGLSGGMLVWNKLNGETSFSDGEIAYCSFNNKVDIVYYRWSGMIQGKTCSRDFYKAIPQEGDKRLNEKRIHPTQKPVKLYEWIFHNYAKPTDKILDSHVGSGSSRIAAHKAGLDFTGFEIDPKYHKAQETRYNNFKAQTTLNLK
jgi:site-specific DNA-methyltransferase (adenine-specific)